MSRISDFCAWLRAKEGAAYVWGAEGHEIRGGAVFRLGQPVCGDYREWLSLREAGEENERRARAFIEAKFASGAESVECFDCSGLVMHYVKGMRGWLKQDLSARGLHAISTPIERSELAEGDLVFRHNGEKVHHVGVYLGGGMVIESKGRDAGVVIRDIAAGGPGYWNRYGMLMQLYEEDGAEGARAAFASCAGGSVFIRAGAGKEHRALAIAHRGCAMLALDGEGGWAKVAVDVEGRLVIGYMSEKYIKKEQIKQEEEE